MGVEQAAVMAAVGQEAAVRAAAVMATEGMVEARAEARVEMGALLVVGAARVGLQLARAAEPVASRGCSEAVVLAVAVMVVAALVVATVVAEEAVAAMVVEARAVVGAVGARWVVMVVEEEP